MISHSREKQKTVRQTKLQTIVREHDTTTKTVSDRQKQTQNTKEMKERSDKEKDQQNTEDKAKLKTREEEDKKRASDFIIHHPIIVFKSKNRKGAQKLRERGR